MPILKQFKTPFGLIKVMRQSDGTLAYVQNGCYHSQANAKGISVCAYTHVMSEIIRQKKARNVLIIGCGGGTLATMIHRLKASVTIVDINPVAFTIARDFFRMPKAVNCITHDGLEYVATTKKRYDAVIIDVFDSHNNVPAGFTTKTFLGDTKKILSRGGVVMMNMMAKTARDRAPAFLAAKMKAVGLPARMCEWSDERDRNVLIVGGALGRVRIPSGKEPDFIQDELEEFAWR